MKSSDRWKEESDTPISVLGGSFVSNLNFNAKTLSDFPSRAITPSWGIKLRGRVPCSMHESRICGYSSNPVCGFSVMEQVRLTENLLGSSMNHIEGWKTL